MYGRLDANSAELKRPHKAPLLSRDSPPPSIDSQPTPWVFDGKAVVRGYLKPPKPLGAAATPSRFISTCMPGRYLLNYVKNTIAGRLTLVGVTSYCIYPVLIPVASYRTSPRASATPNPEGLQGVRNSSPRSTTSSTIASTTPRTTPTMGESRISPRYGHITWISYEIASIYSSFAPRQAVPEVLKDGEYNMVMVEVRHELFPAR